ncbi:MAG: bifunctional folylpolyglutamate synthase/dihydrofolate synthase, partial [Ruminococcus sp.]|nr:bifunctional folylpolyglutamate synthase/dihydrofolate synthase [Ruminococcus sp.]
ITELARLLGDPQDSVKVIHIAGTNGKGSFGAMLGAVLRKAGYKTGWFSSPAITDVTDGFRIGGECIPKERFAEIISYVNTFIEEMDEKPTEFEVLTAAAYELFRQEGCDIAMIECGMGGDSDSTNIVRSPLLSVITNVQSDHQAFLGDTIAEIAAHKAGIIKQGRPVFFGGESETALEVVSVVAHERSAKLYTPDYSQISWDVGESSLDGISFVYRGQELRVPMLGTYQYINAINVLSCIDILRGEGLDIPDEAVRDGLAGARWHGRFEVMRTEPCVVYDGAHNPDGIRHAAQTIQRYFGETKTALLIGVMADKEYALYADMLGGLTERVFAVKPDNPRSLDPKILAGTFGEAGITAEAFDDLREGVREAFEFAKGRGIPLIALGSLYMYRKFTDALAECE